MSASRVKQGNVYVEIGADPRQFFRVVDRVQKRIGSMGRAIAGAGAGIAGAGLGLAAPFIASVRAGARFQDTLLNIKASTGATQQQLDAVRASAMDMSAALGIGPTEVTSAFLELLKAGMSLDDVLGGAGQTAIQFAKVGQMDVAQAAVVMSDAMNVFGVSAGVAANSISSAADASSTSIEQMSQSFAMSSAVAALANQSIGDLSAALAIMANNGVKGSDAGTSVKTMLLRLMAPAEDAIGALDSIGLSMQSFRGADGQMLPLVEIIRTLNNSMAGLDQAATDDLFRRIFGADAIRAAAILTATGVEGFEEMQQAMGGALPVGEKFQALMSGLSGSGKALLGALERLAIAISDAVAPAIQSVAPVLVAFANGLTQLVRDNPQAVALIAKLGVAAVALGGSLTGVGLSLRVAAYGIGGLTGAAKAAAAPLVMLAQSAVGVGSAFASVGGGLATMAARGVGSVATMTTSAGVALVRLTAGIQAAAGSMAASAVRMAGAMAGTALAGVVNFARLGIVAVAQYSARSTALMTIAAANSGRMATASVAATVSVVAASVARAAEGNIAIAASGVRALTSMGAAGVANAMVVSSNMATAAASTSTALIVSGARASTALATVGTSAISASGRAIGAFSRSASAVAGVGASAVAASTSAAGAFARVGAAGAAAGSVTLANFAKASAAMVVGGARAVASWVAGLAAISASAVASGAVAAAAFLAPFAGVVVAIAAAVATAAAFKEQISGALNSIGGLISNAAGALGDGFNVAVADAGVVLSDLYATAQTTFSGIYDAVMSGDLMGAMDILWAGLVAGWLRGTEAIMGYVDSWTTVFQNVFTDLGTGIAVVWDELWTMLATNEIGATLLGFFDNIANGIMATWDWLVASIQKAWIRVQGLITGAKDTKERIKKIDDENKLRAEQREQERPGVEGRVATARKDSQKLRNESQARQDAMYADAEEAKAARAAANEQRAGDRRQATMAAEQTLADKTAGASNKRDARLNADELITAVGAAETMDELRALAAQFQSLNAAGMLSQAQQDSYNTAVDRSAERITEANSGKPDAAAAGEQTGKEIQRTASETVGTFSAMAVGGMGFGSSLAERTAKAAEETARNTKQMANAESATVGE